MAQNMSNNLPGNSDEMRKRAKARLNSMMDQAKGTKYGDYAKTVPASARRNYLQARTGKASATNAIKAFCMDCMGYDRDAVKYCTSKICPLLEYRPFRED